MSPAPQYFLTVPKLGSIIKNNICSMPDLIRPDPNIKLVFDLSDFLGKLDDVTFSNAASGPTDHTCFTVPNDEYWFLINWYIVTANIDVDVVHLNYGDSTKQCY